MSATQGNKPGTIRPSRFCSKCSYPLEGISTGVCPECGENFNFNDPSTYSPVAGKSSNWLGCLFALIAVVLLSLVQMLLLDDDSASHRTFTDWLAIGLVLFVGLVAYELESISRFRKTRYGFFDSADWKRLDKLHRRYYGWTHPIVRLGMSVLAPGIAQLNYAIDLLEMGREDEAVEMGRSAARSSERSNKCSPIVYPAFIHILLRTGHYGDAERVISNRLGQKQDVEGAVVQNALLNLYHGRFSDAVEILSERISHPRADVADVSVLYLLQIRYFQGQFNEVERLVARKLTDASTNLSDQDLRRMSRTQSSKKDLDILRERHAQQMLLRRLLVFGEMQRHNLDAEGLADTASRLEVMGLCSQPIYFHAFRLMLVAHAIGRYHKYVHENMNTYLQVVEDVAVDRRSKIEHFLSSANIHLLMSDPNKSLTSVDSAADLAIHPIDKHQVKYTKARALLAAGKRDEAHIAYESVIADNFDTFMHREAEAALAKL